MVRVKWIFALTVVTIILSTCCVRCKLESTGSVVSNFSSSPRKSDGYFSDEDTGELKTFQQVEGKMRRIIDSVIRQLLPYVIRASSDIRLSGKCMASIFKLVIGMQKLREWAIRMIDATGKPPSGVIQGTSMALGDFDECIDVKVGRGGKYPERIEDEYFHGKYCTIECRLPQGILDAVDEYNAVPEANRSETSIGKSKTFFKMLSRYTPFVKEAALRFGVCVPSTCNEDDLESVVGIAIRQLGFPLKVLHCQEKPKLTFLTEHKIILPILGMIIMTVLVGTAYEVYVSRWKNTNSKHEDRWYELAKKLSISRNTRALFEINETDNHAMPMLRGMFFLTVVFNVLAHTYLMYNHLFFHKYSSVVNYFEFMKHFSFSFIANGSNGIENYFFIAGFMMTYARWKLSSRAPKIDLSRLIIKPYIRMGLLQLLVIALFLCIPLVGFGPFWKDFVGPYLQNCRQRWYLNLFFIQNYWIAEDSCLYHTWLLAVVMQLYIISAFILWALIKKPSYGIGLTLGIIIIAMAIVGATVFVKDLPGALSLYLVDMESATKMWNTLFIWPFDHVGAFCIGLLTGFMLAKYQYTVKIKPTMVVMCWSVSVASLLAVIFGLYEYRFGGQKMNPSLAILYAMLNRIVYSLFLAWFTVAAATGNAWSIPNILGWKALIPGYRLSFLAYLIHLVVVYYHVGIIRERVYLSHEENIINYFGYLMTTYLLAFVCYVFFQAPYMNLEKELIRRICKKPRKCITGTNSNETMQNGDITVMEDREKTKKAITDFGVVAGSSKIANPVAFTIKV